MDGLHLPSLTCMVTLSFQLIYLQITRLLFPTSDFWHPVVTPALVCLSQLLTKVCPLHTQQGPACYTTGGQSHSPSGPCGT